MKTNVSRFLQTQSQICFLIVTLIGVWGLEPGIYAAEPRPNIVFILSDDQRYDSLGAAGNHEIKTPNLDGLAKDGILFTHATVCVSLCAPSRASLLTGLLPHQHG